MSGAGLEVVPEARRDLAAQALYGAGLHEPLQLSHVSGGVSGALICRVEATNGRALLRLEPERIAPDHRRRAVACMAAAAEAGVAPPVRFADPERGVAVTDFVDARPLSAYPGGAVAVAAELGAMVARLQRTPPFAPLVDDGDPVASLLEHVRQGSLFEAEALAVHAQGLAAIRAVRPWDRAAAVSSHNDPNPRNMLFDGRRLWLIDWELACCNDPLFDLAILSTETAQGPALEEALFVGARGRPPGRRVDAQLRLVRLLTRLFYGCIVIDSLAGQMGVERLTLDTALTPEAFAAEAAEGRLGPSAIARAFSLMSLRAFADGVAAADFNRLLDQATEP